jgi:flagellar hook assembly protein FlgD
VIQVNLKIPDQDQFWKLGDAYPNPFDNYTNITYSVAQETNVRIEIYNATGQKIKILTDEVKTAGKYTITWDRTNQNGKQVPSETYFYRMITNNYSEVKTLIYMGK